MNQGQWPEPRSAAKETRPRCVASTEGPNGRCTAWTECGSAAATKPQTAQEQVSPMIEMTAHSIEQRVVSSFSGSSWGFSKFMQNTLSLPQGTLWFSHAPSPSLLLTYLFLPFLFRDFNSTHTWNRRPHSSHYFCLWSSQFTKVSLYYV